jgi:hypothetical protein
MKDLDNNRTNKLFANDELLKEKEKMMRLGITLGFKILSKFYLLVIIFLHYVFCCFKIF